MKKSTYKLRRALSRYFTEETSTEVRDTYLFTINNRDVTAISCYIPDIYYGTKKLLIWQSVYVRGNSKKNAALEFKCCTDTVYKYCGEINKAIACRINDQAIRLVERRYLV